MAVRTTRVYRADRVEPLRWVLSIDGEPQSDHRSYRAAVQHARALERRFRTKGALLRNMSILVVCLVALALVVEFRHVANPDREPARAFVERMEGLARAAVSGSVVEPGDGIRAAPFLLEVGTEGTQEVWVVTGEFDEDCYLIRWRPGEAPFVAVLAPRLPCEPGPAALSSALDAYERVAVQLFDDRPIDWDPVLPEPENLAVWFYPVVFAAGFVTLRTLVSLSIIAIQRGVPTPAIPVERWEPGDQPQRSATSR